MGLLSGSNVGSFFEVVNFLGTQERGNQWVRASNNNQPTGMSGRRRWTRGCSSGSSEFDKGTAIIAVRPKGEDRR